MKPTTIIYWTRTGLGVVAALVTTLLGTLVDVSLFNGISIALFLYVVTYYVYKPLFLTKVEKPSKILSTGIGAYFLTWVVTWTLLYTLYYPVPS